MHRFGYGITKTRGCGAYRALVRAMIPSREPWGLRSQNGARVIAEKGFDAFPSIASLK